MEGDAVERKSLCYSLVSLSLGFLRPIKNQTCFIGQSEDDSAVSDAAHVPDGGDTAVVGVVLGSQVLQLQDFRFPLQLRAKDKERHEMCASVYIYY